MKRALALALLLSACATPHDAPRVVALQPASLGLSNGATAVVAPDWWRAFNDPQLDRLVEMGLSNNPTLDQALARLRAAQAQIEDQQAGLRPTVTGSAQVSRARIAERLFPPPVGGDDANIGIAGASLRWDLDLFGRQRALVRQAASASDAAALDYAAARLTVSTAIAQAYVGLARAERLIEVADGFVQTRQRAVGLVQSRIRNQLSSQLDLRAVQTLLAQAEEARTLAVQQRDVLVHALAALAGRGADLYPQITRPTLALDRAPQVPDALPADLLGRRPDLLAGRARIDAALQGRRAAAAAFLPDVNISALAGLTAVGLGHFFSGDAFSYSAGPAISLPIFEGGRLRAQYRGATADLDGAVASYNDAVVGAVRDAADAITNVRAGDQSLADQRRVVAGFRDTVRLNDVRTRTGLGSQLDAIDSGFRLLGAEQDLVTLQADALTRRIQLVAALGGGFDPARPIQAAANAPDPRS